MRFTKAQRRWIKAAFMDYCEIHTVCFDKEAPQQYRTFVALLSRRTRAAWRGPVRVAKKETETKTSVEADITHG